MRYPNVTPAVFLARPNRFVAHVELDGETVVCHVKNTGRCRELLVPGEMCIRDRNELEKDENQADSKKKLRKNLKKVLDKRKRKC